MRLIPGQHCLACFFRLKKILSQVGGFILSVSKQVKYFYGTSLQKHSESKLFLSLIVDPYEKMRSQWEGNFPKTENMPFRYHALNCRHEEFFVSSFLRRKRIPQPNF